MPDYAIGDPLSPDNLDKSSYTSLTSPTINMPWSPEQISTGMLHPEFTQDIGATIPGKQAPQDPQTAALFTGSPQKLNSMGYPFPVQQGAAFHTGEPFPTLAGGDPRIAPNYGGKLGGTSPSSLTDDEIDHHLSRIIPYENAGRNPLLGWGNTDLSGYKLTETGFPDWPGKPGPQGNSTAAGIYQITKSTWDPIAKRLGITDFSPESQQAVARELFRERGYQPWTVGNARFAQSLGSAGGAYGSADFNGTLNNALAVLNKPATASGVESSSSLLDSTAQSPWQRLMTLTMIKQLTDTGTHKFTPVTYDPWKFAPQSAASPTRVTS